MITRTTTTTLIVILVVVSTTTTILTNNNNVVYAADLYRDHDGKMLTEDQFDTRISYCKELIDEGEISIDESNCNKWVLTYEGEYKIVGKIFQDSDLWKNMKD